MNANTMPTLAVESTHVFPNYVRDHDRRRAALAMRTTMAMWRRSPKQTARALDRHRTTVVRWTDGEHDSVFSRAREALRDMAAQGIYGVPVILDLAADLWTGAAVQKRSLEELRERERQLRREHAEVSHRVELYHLDVAEGVARDEAEVDELLLENASRSLELYALRQELKLRTGK